MIIKTSVTPQWSFYKTKWSVKSAWNFLCSGRSTKTVFSIFSITDQYQHVPGFCLLTVSMSWASRGKGWGPLMLFSLKASWGKWGLWWCGFCWGLRLQKSYVLWEPSPTEHNRMHFWVDMNHMIAMFRSLLVLVNWVGTYKGHYCAILRGLHQTDLPQRDLSVPLSTGQWRWIAQLFPGQMSPAA